MADDPLAWMKGPKIPPPDLEAGRKKLARRKPNADDHPEERQPAPSEPEKQIEPKPVTDNGAEPEPKKKPSRRRRKAGEDSGEADGQAAQDSSE